MDFLETLEKYYSKGEIIVRNVHEIQHKEEHSPYQTAFYGFVFPLNPGEVIINDQLQQLFPGDLLVIAQGEWIEFRRQEETFRHINLFFQCPEWKGYYLLRPQNQKKLISILQHLEREYRDHQMDVGKIRLLNNLFFEVLFHQDIGQQREKKQVVAMIEFMKNSMDKKITVRTLADKFQLSRNRISYLFFKHTGKRPIDYLIDLKMDVAESLLSVDKMTLADIAHTLGYEDPYYLSRLFKKRKGRSPKQFREDVKNGLG